MLYPYILTICSPKPFIIYAVLVPVVVDVN
jgi:hypothetical protein